MGIASGQKTPILRLAFASLHMLVARSGLRSLLLVAAIALLGVPRLLLLLLLLLLLWLLLGRLPVIAAAGIAAAVAVVAAAGVALEASSGTCHIL